jgi:hypothetical protein
VTQVARRQATDAEILVERRDRSVHEAQVEILEPPVDLHRARESEVLPGRIPAATPPLGGSSGQQPIVRRSERNRDGPLPGKCMAPMSPSANRYRLW